jgi:hypothetical protein
MEHNFEFNNISELADLIEYFQGAEFDAQERDELISILDELDVKLNKEILLNSNGGEG